MPGIVLRQRKKASLKTLLTENKARQSWLRLSKLMLSFLRPLGFRDSQEKEPIGQKGVYRKGALIDNQLTWMVSLLRETSRGTFCREKTALPRVREFVSCARRDAALLNYSVFMSLIDTPAAIMYLEHFHLTHSPFQEEPDPEIFFPGAKREDICQSLILDILSGKPLVKLIGREGSGKTLVSRVIIDRLPARFEVVSIDNPVGSFDDLLRIACIDLGMQPLDQPDSANLVHELQRLLERRRAADKKTVLLIDEAEKLFLATLERLVRYATDHPENLGLTIVLCGRPGLDANLAQLSQLSLGVDTDAGYVLPALTENETRQYLRYRLNAAGLAREQHEEIFTEGAVAKIFKSAEGNLRTLNILAEESLQVSCSEKSFMVLLDHVDPEAGGFHAAETSLIEMYELLRDNRRLTAALAGIVVLVFLIGFMLSGHGGKESPRQAATEKSLIVPGASQPLVPQPAAVAQNFEAAAPAAQSATREGERRDGGKIFRERLGASTSWLAGAYRGGYTIQLMMLASDQAQASITNSLVQDDYYQLREQFYILRKKTNPPTLFVFYGIYDTMDAAREARNNMPVFLRTHHPYPVSISDALKKVEN